MQAGRTSKDVKRKQHGMCLGLAGPSGSLGILLVSVRADWGRNRAGHSGQHCPQAKAEVVGLQTRAFQSQKQ